MKHSYFLFFCVILFFYKSVYPNANIQITFVSHDYDSPSAGTATLIIDVEAISTSSTVDINVFQDAIEADANLRARITSTTFSMKVANLTNYNTTEDFNASTGRIRFVYTYNSGSKAQIATNWTRIVRITIQYNMIDQTGSINWFAGEPFFLVRDGDNYDITGSEQSIPLTLINFPLPVELSSFTASLNQSAVNLKWQTKTEINNYGFEIERSISENIDKPQWEKLGFIRGNGNSNSPKEYSYIDKNPNGGSKFAYRLKQIDNDGKFEYSEAVEIEIVPVKFELYQNYPNPFNPVTNIKFSLPVAERVRLDIYNIIGEHVSTLLDNDMEAGFHSIQFDGKNLTSGTYIYRIQTKDFTQTRKMLLIK